VDIGLTLTRNANRTPEKIAFKFGENEYTYSQFNKQVNRLANGLIARGINKGDKIAMMMKNSDLYVVVFYASMKVGAVAVPINFRLTEREVQYILKDSDAVALFFDSEYGETIDRALDKNEKVNLFISTSTVINNQLTYSEMMLDDDSEPGVCVNESDDAEILYTSGTTGNPKGALFDHHRVLHVGFTSALLFKVGPEDNLLHVAPLFHSAQLNLFLISGTFIGCTQVIHQQFDPEQVLKTIEKEKISLFFGIPTMYNFLLQVPDKDVYDLSSIKRYGYGAAPMPDALIEQSIKLFGNDQIYNLCGLTEGGPGGVFLNPEQHKKYMGAGGKAILSTEARVVAESGKDVKPNEVGEFIIKSEMVMKHYYNNPEETNEALRDGWLYTGDLATIDEDGIITLVDRKKDMIISGGENIYSTEVEHVLYRYPSILEVAVVGMPDDTWGERVVAVVVPKAGETIDYDDLRTFCKSSLAGYKVPTAFYEETFILRNASGKIMKYKIREKLVEKEPVDAKK